MATSLTLKNSVSLNVRSSRYESKLSQNVRQHTARARPVKGGAVRQTVTMMPIGVPKVPYRTPGENQWQWVDIWNCLYRERIVFIGQHIDEELGNQLVGTMLYLDSIDKSKDIYFYINSGGGEIVPTLAIHDTMKHIRSKVGTCGFGGAMAMAGMLLACGEKGKRSVLPNTKIMLHQPSGTARGQAADIYNEAKELLRLREYLCNVLSVATGHTKEEVKVDFNRDTYFTPEQAIEYGVIDQIIFPRRSSMMGL
mmetsp:Transcript_15485/g.21370  ORF Transcript_15485/g.21370 Transcript_15485/m.21370 type:complete len:253 (+) Transcript_15485:53-811(+)|eukprot:CAMPEP_0196571126 /NCGR_PEP_ID=MMETSP1081-20130531/1290_1 /TAXON_ID=36882 /ORGANISM="Pyramimonas amylifera, Strain CCMP720" /LENGTH=252 /DNA_ID=CAMNT_0041887915 /DNA_START=53 /DNA_END=811 /DNA_ORIENTATION=-